MLGRTIISLLVCLTCSAQLPVIPVITAAGKSGFTDPFTNVPNLYIELIGYATTNWTGTTNGGGGVTTQVTWYDMTQYHNDFTNAQGSAAPSAGGMGTPAYINNGPNGFYVLDFQGNGNSVGNWKALTCKYDLETNVPNTVFMVAEEISTSGGNTLWDCGTGSRLSLRIGTAGTAWFGPSGSGPPAFANTGNYFIFSSVFNGFNSVLRTNGVFCSRQNCGGPSSMGRTLLGQDISGATAYTGKIAALLCYERALHSNEVAYVEGQLNKLFSLGYTITTNGGFDVGAAWGDRVVVNGGSAPSSNSKVALTALAEGIISDGFYTNILASVYYATDNLVAATTPVIGYKGNDPWVNHNFVSGDLTVNGLVGNTTTKYLDTGVSASGLVANNTALFSYAITFGSGSGGDLNSQNGASSIFELVSDSSGTTAFSAQYNTTTGLLSPSTKGAGYYCGSRTSSSSHNLYFANSGNAHSSISSQSTSGGTLPAFNIFAHAENNAGSPAAWSDTRFGAMGIAFGLTSGQSSSLFSRLTTWRTAEGGSNP